VFALLTERLRRLSPVAAPAATEEVYIRREPMKLIAAIRDLPPPYWVCIECRIIVPEHHTMGPCPRCSSRPSCYPVFIADDVTDVLQSLLGRPTSLS